ncbi:AAA family ATPase [Rhodococcoides yunnanense]|uniref:AAA family ATPase n=1 Tax=Rhodococcoides yunnanense TaxID=278209 RepID=UPI00093510A3|nr:AAA family ATPase [Rhodococcus yunnanensis]
MILGPNDPVPRRPSRIVVAGTSGSGKTTLAKRLAAILDVQHIEIDALYHGSGWTPRESFEADVDEFIAQHQWVTEWQYRLVRDRLADRAELVVWIDLPRRTVMRQLIVRTVRRSLTREVLWNGNIEPPLYRIFVETDHIVRFAWTSHRGTTERIAQLAERLPELPIVRLRSRRAIDRWVAGAVTGDA